MADLVITATDVTINDNTDVLHELVQVGTSGVTPGEVLYLNTSTSKYELADADNTQETAESDIRTALSYGDTDEYVFAVEAGKVDFGAILATGELYIVSANAGKIAPFSDATTGWRITTLGFAEDTSVLAMSLVVTGITL